MLLPVAFVLLQAFPRMKLWAAPIGFLIMCLALALSSFATNTGHLIVSQGVAYGIGASLAYAPTIVFMDDWFVQRRGLAFGIMWVSIYSPHSEIECSHTNIIFSRLEPACRASFSPLLCNGS
jgi:MFS family permease